MNRMRNAFTLIELMVVLVVMGLLAGLLFPVVSAGRERGRQAQCANNLKELHSGLVSFLSSSGGRYPFATTYKDFWQDQQWHERRGWVGPRVPQATDAAGSISYTDMWDDGTCKGTTCITNGTLYHYVTDKRVYLCPTFEREFRKVKKNATPVRSYVMNWALNDANLYAVTNGSRLLLFTELNLTTSVEGSNVTAQTVVSTGGSWPTVPAGRKMYSPYQTDGCIMSGGSTLPPLEGIAAYHNGKGNAVFADGHIEATYFHQTYRLYVGGIQ